MRRGNSKKITFKGILGVHLKSTICGRGAYIEDFYRKDSMHLYPAESSGDVKIGDMVSTINDVDVSDWSVSDIEKTLKENADKFVTISFQSPPNASITIAEVCKDMRAIQLVSSTYLVGPKHFYNRKKLRLLYDVYIFKEYLIGLASLEIWLERILNTAEYDDVISVYEFPEGQFSYLNLEVLQKHLTDELEGSILSFAKSLHGKRMLSYLGRSYESMKLITPTSLLSSPLSRAVIYMYCKKMTVKYGVQIYLEKLIWFLNMFDYKLDELDMYKWLSTLDNRKLLMESSARNAFGDFPRFESSSVSNALMTEKNILLHDFIANVYPAFQASDELELILNESEITNPSRLISDYKILEKCKTLHGLPNVILKFKNDLNQVREQLPTVEDIPSTFLVSYMTESIVRDLIFENSHKLKEAFTFGDSFSRESTVLEKDFIRSLSAYWTWDLNSYSCQEYDHLPEATLTNFSTNLNKDYDITLYGIKYTYYTKIRCKVITTPETTTNAKTSEIEKEGDRERSFSSMFTLVKDKVLRITLPLSSDGQKGSLNDIVDVYNHPDWHELQNCSNITAKSEIMSPVSVCRSEAFSDGEQDGWPVDPTYLEAYVPQTVVAITTIPSFESLRISMKNIIEKFDHADFKLSTMISDNLSEILGCSLSLGAISKPVKIAVPRSLTYFADAPFHILLEMVSPRNLVTLVISMVLEQRLLISCTSSKSITPLLGEFLRKCINPLRWLHIYEPNLPSNLFEDVLQCPFPYFIGTSHGSSTDQSNVLIYNIDSDTCKIPQNMVTRFRTAGKDLVKKIERCMKPSLYNLDKYENKLLPLSTNFQDVVSIFNNQIKMWLERLKRKRISVSVTDSVGYIFDNTVLVSDKDDVEFIQSFADTQMAMLALCTEKY